MNIDKIFDLLNTESVKNPFGTYEEKELFEKLYEAIPAKTIDKENEKLDVMNELVRIERLNAFKVGFKTAVSLFVDGLKGAET